MNYFYPYALPAHNTYRVMYPTANTAHMQWYNNCHYLPPINSQHLQPLNLVTSNIRGPHSLGLTEYHHYYRPSPMFWSNPYWNYQRVYANPPPLAPRAPSPPKPQRFQQAQSGAWPEGFTLRGELRWGRLERVYGPRRELPEFVREDLRRVYGTFPRTDLSIVYQGGEYVVRGDPHVGQQEYRVERRVVRQEESPEEHSVIVIGSEAVEKRRNVKLS